ncbi:circadian clock-controlled protein daywake-like [Aricia agestis]|uniref:circadian clock-controlled protein daywake-like n=1 Tax=Aricia agestis TaxID=91739 RepID=UPI001C20220D|nr:circadian clock-controlled protein daywake-like [Aricia agestis]
MTNFFFENNAVPITPCSTEDTDCLIATANDVYQQFMVGIPDLDIEPHEPMFHPLITGDLPMLQLKLINTSFSGMDKCRITDFKLDTSALNLNIKMSCGVIKMRGSYELSGQLIVMPVEGSGDCGVVAEGYDLTVDSTFKLEAGRMTIKTYQVDAEATGRITFDFKNLFNGQKELSDTVHHFANTNWKDVADFVEQPIWSTHVKLMVTTANKYLKSIQL